MDSLVQWFTANLSGVISKEAIIFIISMIPILEEGSVFPWYCAVAGTQSDEQKRADREI